MLVKIKTYSFFIAFSLLIYTSGYADEVYTGRLLLEDFSTCETDPKGYRCGRAAVFVKGYAKRLFQGRVSATQTKKLCMPTNVGVAQLNEIVMAFLDSSEKRLHELAFWLVKDALIEHFQCEK